MTVRCPKDPTHKEFVTVATVTEDWVVDDGGYFIEVARPSESQVVHGPDRHNIWTCHTCGAAAIIED